MQNIAKTQIIKLAEINPSAYNPRVELSPRDQEYKALSASIDENGLLLPLTVNLRDMSLISGHQRYNVLRAAGETETECVVIDVPVAQAKAIMTALNKLDGEWDYGQLADILQELINEQENLISTGFTDREINELLGDIGKEIGDLDEDPESVAKKDDVSVGIKCVVGDFNFKLDEVEFEDLMADVREKVGFTQELVCAELKRRLFNEV